VEDHGLFGAIDPTPEPGTIGLMIAGLGLVWIGKKRVAKS